MSKIGKKFPKKMIFVGNFALSVLLTVGLSGCVKEAEVVTPPSYVESSLPTELETLINDCKELEEMNKNTASVEKQISARTILLKEELRLFIEQSLDVPVTLDGQLLTYEEISKERKAIDEEIGITDPNWARDIGVFEENGCSFYYYTKRTIYQLDVDEECMMTLIRFVNSKKAPTASEILIAIECYEQAKKISYGYRTAYLTCIDEKAEVGKNTETTVYTGTIFNNTEYSLRTIDLTDKILLKVRADYVVRTGSKAKPEDYLLTAIDGKWLIVHRETGATDLLDERESELCIAVTNVQLCLDHKGMLANSKEVDIRIETLQNVLEEYLKGNEEKQK